jgi:flavin reductase (DIM6/NTAB) family NADH-FMN oxidoreductase RutF
MSKTTLGPRTIVYPMPVFLIGTSFEGKANFMTAAWSGIANSNPPMITVGIQHHRHSMKGIKANMTFSVNVPSVELVKEADYCGIVSGAKEDKVAACKFTVFTGKLDTAPLIKECPVNLECKVVHILNLGTHALVVGEIEETHVSDFCLVDGEPDPLKVNPLIYTTGPNKAYYSLGQDLAPAFKVGLEIKRGS